MRRILIIALLLVTTTSIAQINNDKKHLPAHPRLIFMKGAEENVLSMIKKDKRMLMFHNYVTHYADSILTLPCNERIKKGIRLLPVSRCNIKYILYLSYSYRMTGKEKYAERAKSELIKLSNFIDWNPSHFLDVAEMGFAAAIGYDWLYDYLDTETRKTVEDAIIEKIINPSFGKYAFNMRRKNNWNQVCNAGVSAAALAIYERIPELTIKSLNRGIKNLPVVMKEYSPNGAYTEGYGYWGYGTTYNVIFIDLLQKLFGSDYGLKEQEGFMQTANFHQALVTPALNYYNYGDNKNIPAKSISPAVFWFYKETKDQDLLYNFKRILSLDKVISDDETVRFSPLALVWAAEGNVCLDNIKAPKKDYFQGFGANPVVVFRSTWSDDNAAFIGFKGGNDRISHGHQDAGSFVFEENKVRWALELGQENYHNLEEAKLKLWGRDRWKVYRYNCFNHNMFTFDGKPIKENQFIALDTIKVSKDVLKSKNHNSIKSDGIESFSCEADLSPLFEGQIRFAKRKIALVAQTDCVIEDCINCSNNDVVLCWRMASETEKITKKDDNTIILHKGEHKLSFKVLINDAIPENITMSLQPAVSQMSYDSPNPGINFVQFKIRLKANSKNKIKVIMSPENFKI